MDNFLYYIYKNHVNRNNRLLMNLAHYYQNKLKRPPEKSFYPQNNNPSGSRLKIALICDEFTYRCFEQSTDVYYLTPQNWRQTLKNITPDLFFCESAWVGNDQNPDVWKCRIYRNHKLWLENRIELLEILRHCDGKGVRTVFWNKDDPLYIDDILHDFMDTAAYFDVVLTTCAESIPAYARRGIEARLWMFGVEETLFNCGSFDGRENVAVFVGGWHGEIERRCRELEYIFDALLESGIGLKIYDRFYGSVNLKRKFPDKYRPYCLPALPYSELGGELAKYRYGITVNTVTESETMFARRVFELMACGLVVISNNSEGLQKMFGDKSIWFIGEGINTEIPHEEQEQACLDNYQYVLENHSFKKRLAELVELAGIGELA